MGIGYGLCDRCTPRHVIELRLELEKARDDARRQFNRETEARKQEYIETQTAALKARYEAEYNKYRPK